MDSKSCDVCQMPANHSCSSCHSSFYCSKECQKKAWKKHKIDCIPYAIEVHPVYGRYVVATRDIEAGEVVLRESPVAIGPQSTSKPLCLGCHRLVTGTYFCSKCNFPLCSSACELSALHEAECRIFSRAKKVACITSFNEHHPAYECILPLRCLLTKYTDTKKWNILNTMKASVESLSANTKERIRMNVIDYLRNYMNFKGVDDAIIYWVCGLLLTNCFEVTQNGQDIAGVYPKVALMAHDCSPNTENIFDNTLRAAVRTTVPIPKGASITTTYTTLLCNTLQRRSHLLISKFFECECLRCADPKELGSHLSTLLCSQCGGQVHSTAPLQSGAVWCCDSCNYSIPSKNVEENHKMLRKSFLERDRNQMRPLEDLIALCDKKLHSTHQVPMEVKIAYIRFCGNHPEYRYNKLDKAQIQTKIRYCRELLQVGDAIFPGRSQYRGMILYELHVTLRAMAKKLLSFGNFNNENVQEYEDEAEKLLQEVRSIFYFKDEMKERGYEDKLKLLTEELGSIR